MGVTLLFSAGMFLVALFDFSWTSCVGESAVPLASADIPAQGAIDEYINREMESQRIPGLSLAAPEAFHYYVHVRKAGGGHSGDNKPSQMRLAADTQRTYRQ